MNRYVKDFPEETHLFENKNDGSIILQIAQNRFSRVDKEVHSRLSKMLNLDTELGRDIYTTVVLLQPYLKRYQTDEWDIIKKDKEVINRIKKGFADIVGITLRYKNSVLKDVTVSIALPTRNQSYIAPTILWERIALWPLAVGNGSLSFEGDFEATFSRGKTFRELKKGLEAGIINAEPILKMRSGNYRNSKKVFFRNKLNALYRYIKDNIEDLKTILDPLSYSLELLGICDDFLDFDDIIGRGYIGKIDL